SGAIMARSGIRGYIADVWEGWSDFWFSPTNPATLSLIRLFAGAMLFYTHFIWSFDLSGFFGPNGWLPKSLMHNVHEFTNGGPGSPPRLMWSYFDWLPDSPA